MADVVFKPEFDDSEIRKGMERMEQHVERVEAGYQRLADAQVKAFQEGGKAANEYDKILTDVFNDVGKTGAAMDKAAKDASTLGDAIESATRGIKIFGVDLGNVVGGIRDFIGKLGEKKAALLDWAKSAGVAQKALRLLAVGGVAGLAAALVGALALFAKFGSNIDAAKRKIQGIKDEITGWTAALVPAVETLAIFSKSIVQFATLKFDKAVNTWTEAQKKWTDEVLATKNEIADLQNVIRALDKMELGARVQNADLQKQIELLQSIAADTEKSDGRRLQALREYEQLQGQVLRRELGIAQVAQQVAETKERDGVLNEERVAALERVRAAEAALAALGRETEQQRRDITNKRLEEERKHREAEQKRLKEALEAYAKLVEKLGDQTDKALLSRLYDPEKLALEREFAIAEVEKFIQELMAAAKAAGTELPATFMDDFKVIFNAIDEELKRGLKEMSNKGLKEAGKNIQEFSDRIAGQQLNALAKAQEDALLSVFDRTKTKLLNSLGLNEEQAAFILQSFGTVFNSIMQMQEAAVNAQLEQQNKLIEASRERISSLEQDVEDERELRRQGLASNLDDAKAALDAERAVLEAAQAKALAIQRKAANQQLVINSIIQASELALSASKIISANSGIPVAGPVIAAAGIALIFSILAQAKANAARFSQVPKLRKGAKLEGESHERGGVPLLVDGSKYYEAEHGEWLIGSAPSKKHDQFLSNLNAGRYDEMNLHALAEQARQRPIGQIITNIHATERKIQMLTKKQELLIMAAAHRQAADAAAEKMIEYWKTRPIDTPLDSPIKRETTVGRKKVVEIIKPK